jgi:hypothetical protein
MQMKNMQSVVVGALVAMMMSLSLPLRAEFVGTEQMLEMDARASAMATVDAFIARDEVRQQLQAWGVAPDAAAERVAALSDAELQQLALNIEAQPAAAGLLEVIGIVFVVLLILELTGVIDIFKAI